MLSLIYTQSSYLFSGQQFVYDQPLKGAKPKDDVTLLLSGYIRHREKALHLDEYIGGVPGVIVKIMCFFVGKKYFIHSAAPKEDEYDYAMELLSPIKTIGFSHKKSRIIGFFTNRARNNIILGSRIVQINDVPVTTKASIAKVDGLLNAAKQHTPSFIVFRCKKELKNKGTHLQFDVSFGDGSDRKLADKRFPYYRFTKDTVQEVMEKVFGDSPVEIMEVYARTHCAHGRWGKGTVCPLSVDAH